MCGAAGRVRVPARERLSLFGSDILGRPTRFVALEHYAGLFTEPDLRRMVLVTLAIAALSTALAIGAGLAAALPLRPAGRGAGVVSLIRQFADTPAVTATAGCLTGAMPGIRTEVVDRMQAAFAGATPVDVTLDEAEKAATDKITAYREQVGQ